MDSRLTLFTLFSTLSAERETWLDHVFVCTPQAEVCFTNQSTIIYGDSGMGKTALRLYLKKNIPSDTLAISWSPEPLAFSTPGTPVAQAAMRQALQALFEQVVQNPEIHEHFQQAPAWVQTALAWFLRAYLPMEPMFYVQTQAAKLDEDALAWYDKILQSDAVDLFRTGHSQNDELRALVLLFKQAGYQQVWWLIDGLEKWPTNTERGTAIQVLIESLLSTLAIFDIPSLHFKVFISEPMRGYFEKTGGVGRDRFNPVRLVWSEEQLQTLLVRRLAKGLEKEKFSLAQLCTDSGWQKWLYQYGGQNPRTWLNLARPFVEKFASVRRPLTTDEWNLIARQSPPPLHILIDRHEIQLGEHVVSVESGDGFKIIQYLAENLNKICSLEEIYFCGIKGLEKIPALQDDKWEHKSLWRPALDTTLYRLRQKLEWDAGNPIYLVTHPRRGIELKHLAE